MTPMLSAAVKHIKYNKNINNNYYSNIRSILISCKHNVCNGFAT